VIKKVIRQHRWVSKTQSFPMKIKLCSRRSKKTSTQWSHFLKSDQFKLYRCRFSLVEVLQTKYIPYVQNDQNDQFDECKALDCLEGHSWSPKKPEEKNDSSMKKMRPNCRAMLLNKTIYKRTHVWPKRTGGKKGTPNIIRSWKWKLTDVALAS
jgi:hypothetical protein